MRKLFPLLSAIFLVACAIVLVNCGDDSHPLTTTNQFAFIREAGAGAAALHAQAREIKGARRLHQHRMTQGGGGLHPWAVEIDPGTDSIIVMNNDGSGGETVAVNQGGWFYSIHVATNGKNVAFTSEITTSGSTYQQVLVATGSGNNYDNYTVTQLTSDAEDHHQAQVSADGSKVVFAKYDSVSGMDKAFVVPASGGAETVVPTPDTMDVYSPTFTPDGKSIVFEDCMLETINIVNLDGTGMKVLNDPASSDASLDDVPSVSPDGKLVTFLQDNNVFVMDITGQNVKQLTTDGMNDDPMFVNNRIVYLSMVDNVGSTEVYSMKPDGTDQKRLTNNTAWEEFQYYDTHLYY